eukprot:6021354-Prymnesium_polylepis.1
MHYEACRRATTWTSYTVISKNNKGSGRALIARRRCGACPPGLDTHPLRAADASAAARSLCLLVVEDLTGSTGVDRDRDPLGVVGREGPARP